MQGRERRNSLLRVTLRFWSTQNSGLPKPSPRSLQDQVAAQRQRVEARGEGLEVRARLRRQDPEGAQARVGSLGPVVEPARAGAGARLAPERRHGLEEIHVPAGELRDTLEVGIGGPGGEAIIPHELPDDGAVLRLDVARSCFFQARLRVKGIP